MPADVNLTAVLVSGMVYWGLGAVWYGALFSRTYAALLDRSPAEQARARKYFRLSWVMNLVLGLAAAYVLAQIVVLAGAFSVFQGMFWGAALWIAFTLTTLLNGFFFDGLARGVVILHLGFYLAAYVILGGILAVWR